MAAPNLLSPSSIKGMTKFVRQTSERILVLDNPIGSGKVLKINSLSKMPAKANSGSGATYFFIVNAEFTNENTFNKFKYDLHINASGNAGVNRWTVINKNEMIYLPEGTALWSNDSSSTSSYITDITISYEEIS
jgi:hypothetical protein